MRSLELSLCFAVVASTLVLGGCKRKATLAGSGAIDQDLPKGTAPVVVATPKGEVGINTKVAPNTPQAEAVSALNRDLSSGNPQLVLKRLNELVDAQEMSGKTAPKSVDDLVKAGLLTQPPIAPGGRRYVVNPKTRRFELSAQ